MDRNVMLCTRVTEDVIVIATGFILFFIANYSFDDIYVEKQEESRKEKSVQKWSNILYQKSIDTCP